MSKVTLIQKTAFLALAKKYDPATFEIVSKGGGEEITVTTKQEAEILAKFGNRSRVGDYEGRRGFAM
jgi:hypothetical protein